MKLSLLLHLLYVLNIIIQKIDNIIAAAAPPPPPPPPISEVIKSDPNKKKAAEELSKKVTPKDFDLAGNMSSMGNALALAAEGRRKRAAEKERLRLEEEAKNPKPVEPPKPKKKGRVISLSERGRKMSPEEAAEFRKQKQVDKLKKKRKQLYEKKRNQAMRSSAESGEPFNLEEFDINFDQENPPINPDEVETPPPPPEKVRVEKKIPPPPPPMKEEPKKKRVISLSNKKVAPDPNLMSNMSNMGDALTQALEARKKRTAEKERLRLEEEAKNPKPVEPPKPKKKGRVISLSEKGRKMDPAEAAEFKKQKEITKAKNQRKKTYEVRKTMAMKNAAEDGYIFDLEAFEEEFNDDVPEIDPEDF